VQLSQWVDKYSAEADARELRQQEAADIEFSNKLTREVERKAKAYHAQLDILESRLRSLEQQSLGEFLVRFFAAVLAFGVNGLAMFIAMFIGIKKAWSPRVSGACIAVRVWLARVCGGYRRGGSPRRCMCSGVSQWCKNHVCSKRGDSIGDDDDHADDQRDRSEAGGPDAIAALLQGQGRGKAAASVVPRAQGPLAAKAAKAAAAAAAARLQAPGTGAAIETAPLHKRKSQAEVATGNQRQPMRARDGALPSSVPEPGLAHLVGDASVLPPLRGAGAHGVLIRGRSYSDVGVKLAGSTEPDS
jgi:hypothetical protein